MALYFRKRSVCTRRRLMLPAVTRLPYGANILRTLAALFLLIAPCLAHNAYARGRLQRANVIGGLLILASVLVRLPIAKTEVWHQLAGWSTR